MNPSQPTPHQVIPPEQEAATARMDNSQAAPKECYQGEITRFCKERYRQVYTEDPLNSCLASRLLTDK